MLRWFPHAPGWLLLTFHFVLARLALFGHLWHAFRVRAKAAGFDFRSEQFVKPYADDSQIGDLATPINSSDFSLLFLNNLPIYRTGLSSLNRGLEIGMAHGYFLIGPFIKLGPLRDSEMANQAGLLVTIGLIVILTICLSIYGKVSFQDQEIGKAQLPEELRTARGWSQFTSGFLIGGVGGAIFAFFLLSNLDLFSKIAQNL